MTRDINISSLDELEGKTIIRVEEAHTPSYYQTNELNIIFSDGTKLRLAVGRDEGNLYAEIS